MTIEKRDKSRIFRVKIVQEDSFVVELCYLKSLKPVKFTSKLASLYPFIDKDEAIRVDGWLKHAGLYNILKHPMVLSIRSQMKVNDY